MSLVKEADYFRFCFPRYVKEVFIDTPINGDALKICKLQPDTATCGYSYGGYSFKKRGQSIYLSVYDSSAKKSTRHRQYSLVRGDSTWYVYLLSSQIHGYVSYEGVARFQGDSTLKIQNGKEYPCYIFQEERPMGFHNKEYLISRIFLDKTTLLPLRYEFYKLDKLVRYYIINRFGK